MRAYTLRPARALTSRAAGLAKTPAATAERMLREEDISSSGVRERVERARESARGRSETAGETQGARAIATRASRSVERFESASGDSVQTDGPHATGREPRRRAPTKSLGSDAIPRGPTRRPRFGFTAKLERRSCRVERPFKSNPPRVKSVQPFAFCPPGTQHASALLTQAAFFAGVRWRSRAGSSVAELRPNLPPAVVAHTHARAHGSRSAPRRRDMSSSLASAPLAGALRARRGSSRAKNNDARASRASTARARAVRPVAALRDAAEGLARAAAVGAVALAAAAAVALPAVRERRRARPTGDRTPPHLSSLKTNDRRASRAAKRRDPARDPAPFRASAPRPPSLAPHRSPSPSSPPRTPKRPSLQAAAPAPPAGTVDEQIAAEIAKYDALKAACKNQTCRDTTQSWEDAAVKKVKKKNGVVDAKPAPKAYPTPKTAPAPPKPAPPAPAPARPRPRPRPPPRTPPPPRRRRRSASPSARKPPPRKPPSRRPPRRARPPRRRPRRRRRRRRRPRSRPSRPPPPPRSSRKRRPPRPSPRPRGEEGGEEAPRGEEKG